MKRILVLISIWFAAVSLPVKAQECSPSQQLQFGSKLKNWLQANVVQSEIKIDVVQLVSGCTAQLKGVLPDAVVVAPKQAALWFETMRVMFEVEDRSFALIFKLKMQKKMWITECDIEVGQALTEDCLRSDWIQVKKLTLQSTNAADFFHKTASKRIPASSVLELADWQPAMAVKAGQKVTIHYRHGAINVQAPATVMKAANVGDKLVVILDGQRQSITARLGKDGDVYID